MSQTRNLTRSMKEIEDIYESVLNEKFDHHEITHKDKETVGFIKDSGPEAADGVKLDEIDTSELSDKEIKDNHYEPAKFSQKSGKVTHESINNSVMSNENIFDKLYKTVMEGEELDEMNHGAYEEDEDLLDDVEPGGEEEAISVKLSASHVEALLDLLAQVEEQVEDEGDDEGDEEADADGFDQFDDDDSLVAEAPTVMTAAPDHLKLTKGNTVGNHKPAGGKAEVGSSKEDGDPKEVGDGHKKLQGKDNKVGANGEFGG
jgi:hypothetical protein